MDQWTLGSSLNPPNTYSTSEIKDGFPGPKDSLPPCQQFCNTSQFSSLQFFFACCLSQNPIPFWRQYSDDRESKVPYFHSDASGLPLKYGEAVSIAFMYPGRGVNIIIEQKQKSTSVVATILWHYTVILVQCMHPSSQHTEAEGFSRAQISRSEV